MSRLLLTAAVLAVLVYTMVLGVRWLSPRIEQDIADRVTTSLAEQGLLWADVEVKGRDVVMSGIAPDAEAKDKALNVASHVFGVSRVEDQLAVAGDASATAVVAAAQAEESSDDEIAQEAKDAGIYTLTITKNGEDVVLEGSVPDEASKDVLVRLANTHYGSANVHADGLTIVRGAPAGWRTAAGAVLIHITNLERARVMISGTEVMVSGSVADASFSDKMEKAVTDVLPRPYKAAFAVEVVTPTAEVEPAAGESSDACASMDEVKKERLHFGFDKADVTANQKPVVDRVAGKMAGCTDEHLVVSGFTDTTGSPLYNKWLSQQRAEAGMRALMREGVAKARLRAVGYGENYPAATNKTRAGRAENRRVEFTPGTELPHPAVRVRKAGKSDTGSHVLKKAAKLEKADVKAVGPKAAKVSTTVVPVSDSAIKKPWWAVKAAETPNDATVEQNRKLEHDMNQLVQPLPKPLKQPELGAGSVEKPWLGEHN